MLRMSYMPSDFHPIVLMIGQAEGVRSLADALDAFAGDGDPLALRDGRGIVSEDTEVTLRVPDNGRIGMFPPAAGRDLDWWLTRDDAAAFADEVRALADGGAPSGSVALDCDVLGEVVVKVSIGEWEEGFLDPGA